MSPRARYGALLSPQLHALYGLKDGSMWAEHSDFNDSSDLVTACPLFFIFATRVVVSPMPLPRLYPRDWHAS